MGGSKSMMEDSMTSVFLQACAEGRCAARSLRLLTHTLYFSKSEGCMFRFLVTVPDNAKFLCAVSVLNANI